MSPAPSPRNVLGLLGAFVVASVVVGMVAAGLAIPAVGAAGLLTSDGVDFFNTLPSELDRPPLSEQSRLLDADGKTITTFYDEYRVSVPLSKISVNMQHAIVAIEDARFYKHGGVDPQGLLRAAVVNKLSGSTEQGASTLTQQLVKNELVEAASARGDDAGVAAARKKDTARKLREIHLAITLEKTMSKQDILEGYLNIVFFGRTINGIEAASRYYFNTTAKNLTLPQAATLAGMVQDPGYYSPKVNPKKALARRNVVLDKMLEQKMIDQATHDKAKATKLGAHITPPLQGCANSGYKAYFCDYVYQQITENKAFSALGKTKADRENTILRGGLTIKTTMDPKIEKVAWKATTGHVEPTNKVATATVTVQPGTGKVLSIAQNKFYDPGKKKTKNTTIDYAVDQEYGGSSGFQTGSTFKPFTLATWLKQGKSLNASVSSATGTAPFSDFKSCTGLDHSQSYTYFNSEGSGKGNMTVWNGTAASVNGVFVSMEKQLDLCDIRDTAEDLGVHLAAPRPDICSTKSPRPYTERLPTCAPSLTLGIEDISPMTMAAAYAAFANKGEYCSPIVITSILDRNKKPVKIPKSNCSQALDEKVANTVNLGLSRVFKPGGTAAHLGGLPNNRPASGKTGTTNGSVNTWFVGYTPQLATSVWVGDPNTYVIGHDSKGRPEFGQKTLNGRKIDGTTYRSVFGATIAAPIWKQIMTTALEGTKIEHFAPADPKLTRTPQTTVPNVDGKPVQDAIDALKAAGFTTNVSSTLIPSTYPLGSVASTSPKGGSKAGTGSEITISVSSGVAPGPGPTAGPGPGNGNGGGVGVNPPN
jgi:membrane peptidoglycan carboxypeptidase